MYSLRRKERFIAWHKGRTDGCAACDPLTGKKLHNKRCMSLQQLFDQHERDTGHPEARNTEGYGRKKANSAVPRVQNSSQGSVPSSSSMDPPVSSSQLSLPSSRSVRISASLSSDDEAPMGPANHDESGLRRTKCNRARASLKAQSLRQTKVPSIRRMQVRLPAPGAGLLSTPSSSSAGRQHPR